MGKGLGEGYFVGGIKRAELSPSLGETRITSSKLLTATLQSRVTCFPVILQTRVTGEASSLAVTTALSHIPLFVFTHRRFHRETLHLWRL